MNTVEALNVLGKALCGDSFEVKPGLTDAETILEIAKNYSGGGSGSSKIHVTATHGTNKIAKDLTEDDLLNMVINFPDGVYPVCSVMYAYTQEQDSVRIPDLFNIMVTGPWMGITYKPSTGDLIVAGD